MLGIHAQRFARGNAKEKRVELVHPIDKGPSLRIHLAGQGTLGGIIISHRPAGGGDRLHQIRPVLQQLPEGFRRVSTGEATRHADDRNRFI